MNGSRITRRSMIGGGLLTGAALIGNSRQPNEPLRMIGDKKIDPLFPKKIADWTYEMSSGLVLPSPEELSDHFYSNLITRYYRSPTQLPIMLLVAYSETQDGMIQVHRPEACYPAAGYEIVRQRAMSLSSGRGASAPGYFISAQGASRNEQLIYWTRIGHDFPTRWWEQHWVVAKENLRGRIPDGVLIRISTAAPDDETALRTLRQFYAAFSRQLSPAAHRLLFGTRSAGEG